MRGRERLRDAVVALSGVLLVASVSVPAPARAATGGAHPGDRYVALGDSFAAGPSIPPMADAACGRSARNYPRLVARALDLSLTDVSCSGATTDDVVSTSQGPKPPQLEAVTPATRLVTLTIGSNDVGYSASTLTCAQDAAQHRSCLGTSVRPTLLEARMAALPTKLRATLAAIEAKAPRATVVVVPYLRVLPAVPVPCPPRVPMDTPTLAFLADVGTELQRALGAAAATANVDFVDTFAPEGHDACAKRRARWVEGARPVSALPFHPGAAGMKATAALIVASLASK